MAAQPTNRGSIGARLPRCLSALLCLAVCSLIGHVVLAEDAEQKIESVYARWVKQYDRAFIKPNEQDPLFLDLLGRADGDLFFLRGLGAGPDQVRRLSRLALGRLKTDRSFESLAKQTKDKDMFVRERAVETLGEFRQDRCVPVLLEVLQTDREGQVRRDAAYALANYRGERVEAALLKVLTDDPAAGYQAALALGELQVAEAVEPTYQLLLATKGGRSQETILMALRRHQSKQAVRRLLDLQDRLVVKDEFWKVRMLSQIQGDLGRLAIKTREITGPAPETPEQCREWWAIAEPLFSDDLRLLPRAESNELPAEQLPAEQLGGDADQLEFSIALDAKTYRVGDPIAVEFSLQNKSTPMRTIPPVTSGWWPTMAYGIHLTRLGDPSDALIATEPTDFYQGSYSGPPHFQTLRAGETFTRTGCLHDWMGWQNRKLWPLAAGAYRLSIVFDNARFAHVHPMPGEIVHRWESTPVEFVVEGAPRTDPRELLKLIAEKSKLKWLDTDLDSKNRERSDPAWYALKVWGDDRLTPALKGRKSYNEYKRNWPLPHFDFGASKPASRNLGRTRTAGDR